MQKSTKNHNVFMHLFLSDICEPIRIIIQIIWQNELILIIGVTQ